MFEFVCVRVYVCVYMSYVCMCVCMCSTKNRYICRYLLTFVRIVLSGKQIIWKLLQVMKIDYANDGIFKKIVLVLYRGDLISLHILFVYFIF